MARDGFGAVAFGHPALQLLRHDPLLGDGHFLKKQIGWEKRGSASSMITVIGLTQFVFVSLGIMAVKILVNAGSSSGEPTVWLATLDHYGLWLFLIPLVWMFCARAASFLTNGNFITKVIQATGVILSALLFIVFAWAILFPYTISS